MDRLGRRMATDVAGKEGVAHRLYGHLYSVVKCCEAGVLLDLRKLVERFMLPGFPNTQSARGVRPIASVGTLFSIVLRHVHVNEKLIHVSLSAILLVLQDVLSVPPNHPA